MIGYTATDATVSKIKSGTNYTIKSFFTFVYNSNLKDFLTFQLRFYEYGTGSILRYFFFFFGGFDNHEQNFLLTLMGPFIFAGSLQVGGQVLTFVYYYTS